LRTNMCSIDCLLQPTFLINFVNSNAIFKDHLYINLMKTGLFIVWCLGTVISLKSVDEHNGPDKCLF